MVRLVDEIAAVALRLNARLIARISAACLVAEVAIALTTLLPNAPVVPPAVVFVLFPGVFIVHFRSVAVLVANRDRSKPGVRFRMREMLRPVPVAARIAFFGFFVVAWLVAMASLSHAGGQPTQAHGLYYLNDHGTLIPVTRREYLHALVLLQRGSTMIPAAFYALGVIINWPRSGATTPGPGAVPAAPARG